MDNETWARVLYEALPYFKQYVSRTVVVKYGGNAMLNEELKRAVMSDIVLLNTIGIRVVLVHGGGPEINAMLEKLNKRPEFINGLRYTDSETMDIVQMVLTGSLNSDIVSLLMQCGGRAVGVSGVDSGLLRAKKFAKDGVDLGLVGEITTVNPNILETLLGEGFIPVVSTVALGEDDDPACYNINADTAAAEIAVALNAEKFVLLTNVPGILRDVSNPETLIKQIAKEAIPSMVATGVISSGMIPKIECCLRALKGGVSRTHVIDGRVPHSLLIEMFSDRGVGTMIV